jgi:hypothetical protein
MPRGLRIPSRRNSARLASRRAALTLIMRVARIQHGTRLLRNDYDL